MLWYKKITKGNKYKSTYTTSSGKASTWVASEGMWMHILVVNVYLGLGAHAYDVIKEDWNKNTEGDINTTPPNSKCPPYSICSSGQLRNGAQIGLIQVGLSWKCLLWPRRAPENATPMHRAAFGITPPCSQSPIDSNLDQRQGQTAYSRKYIGKYLLR